MANRDVTNSAVALALDTLGEYASDLAIETAIADARERAAECQGEYAATWEEAAAQLTALIDGRN